MVQIESQKEDITIAFMVYGYLLHTRDLMDDEYLERAIDQRCKVLAKKLIATLETHSSFWLRVVANYKGSSVMSGYYKDLDQAASIVTRYFANSYKNITFIHPVQAATILAAMR